MTLIAVVVILHVDEVERNTNEIRKQLSSLQAELKSANKRMTSAQKEADQARENLVMQVSACVTYNSMMTTWCNKWKKRASALVIL